MLTEYSTYDELRKFRDKAVVKSWLLMQQEGMKRLLRLKRMEWNLYKSGYYSPIKKLFEVDGQEVNFYIYPSKTKYGTIDPLSYQTNLTVGINTSKGLSEYQFHPKLITISTPHYISRFNERGTIIDEPQQSERHPYIRNGREYELLTVGDNVIVCRRPEPDIIIYVTHLTKDMCTSRNFQAIFAQAGKVIDEHDIYVWK